MVMLGALKKKLGEDMAKPEISVEIEGGEGDMAEDSAEESMPEAKPIDLAAVSDDELMAEVQKRNLMG